jgi:hypothetical protein
VRYLIPFAALLASTSHGQETPEDIAISLTSLRPNERETLEKKLGPARDLPTYRAELHLNIANRTVTGTFSASLPARKNSYLRVLPNGSHDTAISIQNVKLNNIDSTATSERGALIRIDPTQPIEGLRELGGTLKATIPELNKNAKDFGAFSAGESVISLVGLIPLEPLMKPDGTPTAGPSGIGDMGSFPVANIIFSIEVPKGWRAISAGLQLGEIPTKTGNTIYSFGAAGVRELPIFVVKNFVTHEEKFADVSVESWASDAEGAQKLSLLAKEALVLMDKNVGAYPFKTFRVVEVPLVNGAGGMEFQGLVTISATLLHGQSDMSSMFGGSKADPMISQLLSQSLGPLFDNLLEFTVNHEVAHQYFAGLVGNDAVDDPAADEPMAQFMAVKIIEWKHGNKAAVEAVNLNLKMAYQVSQMMGEGDVKARQSTSAFHSTMQYAAAIYAKAPLLHVEQEKLVSAALFSKTLKSYVQEKRYGFVTSKDFSLALQKAAPSHAAKLKNLEKRYWDELHGDDDAGAFDISKLLGHLGQTPSSTGSMKGMNRDLVKAMEEMMKALNGEP